MKRLQTYLLMFLGLSLLGTHAIFAYSLQSDVDEWWRYGNRDGQVTLTWLPTYEWDKLEIRVKHYHSGKVYTYTGTKRRENFSDLFLAKGANKIQEAALKKCKKKEKEKNACLIHTIKTLKLADPTIYHYKEEFVWETILENYFSKKETKILFLDRAKLTEIAKKESSQTQEVAKKEGTCIKGDCSNGQGTYLFSGGNKYVGEYKDDKRHGQGTYTYANGDKYVGEYKDGKYHGQGTYTYADGTIDNGIWKKGKLVKRNNINSYV